jgi:hypothetical protein
VLNTTTPQTKEKQSVIEKMAKTICRALAAAYTEDKVQAIENFIVELELAEDGLAAESRRMHEQGLQGTELFEQSLERRADLVNLIVALRFEAKCYGGC